jgi:predicted ATP-dependent endonuclease of OLD family
MKLNSLEIRNVKSFREEEQISFNDDFNILIGPNGGGKSNLLDILTIILNQFFLQSCLEESNNRGTRLRKNDQFNNVDQLLEKYIGDDSDSRIRVEFEVSPEDIENIENLIEYKDDLRDATGEYYELNGIQNGLNFIDDWSLDELSEGMSIEYEIENNNLQNPSAHPNEVFLEYLRHLDMFIILAQSIEEINLQPSYFYFSPYRGGAEENKEITLHSDNYYQLLHDYLGSTSREQTSAIELAIFKLAEMRREYEYLEGPNDRFFEEQEVQMINEYFEKLGYEWDLEGTNPNENRYEMFLSRAGKQYRMDQLSSGETEILNFLLGILSTDIRNGIIVIDEPELHLHPRWQTVLLELFSDLEELTGNQFIFTTHSPGFITDDTISRVKRVHKDDSDSSRTTSVDESRLSDPDDLVHIINSHNNEKMFFADYVVLVEGISDRLVFQKMIDYYSQEINEPQIVEVLEVEGKGNFSKYADFLENLGVPFFIIGDRGYAKQVGGEEIEELFITDEGKIDDRVLKDDSSRDADTLAARIDSAIESGNTDELEEVREVWRYIRQRLTSFKDELTEEEEETWENFLQNHRENGVYILPHGEIEDHLPDGTTSTEDVLELTKYENFEEWIENDEDQGT